ncbi:hypothetical protein HOL34_00945 [bacterium]|jgi:hypothetical protein|nr:hypothetical protein [bacterium]MBT3903497.1 hypothetical protein [bacterium]MBT4577995.1 hypothetical protein [bacterium]MBT5346220.1 hypothetical protein [bacterium]MBT6131016.1 hypothetical protein [bacterium]
MKNLWIKIYTLMAILTCTSGQLMAVQKSSSSSSSPISQSAYKPTSPKITVIERAPNMRRLIMLFDFDFNLSPFTLPDAMSTSLATALAQKAAPILISKQLLYNFYQDVSRYQKAYDIFKSKTPQHKTGFVSSNSLLRSYFQIMELIAPNNLSRLTRMKNSGATVCRILDTAIETFDIINGGESVYQQASQNIISYKTQMKPESWNIYTVNDLFYLLVPKKYEVDVLFPDQILTNKVADQKIAALSSINTRTKDAQTGQLLTRREQKLGMKVDKLTAHSNLKTINDIKQFVLSVDQLKTSQSHQNFMLNKDYITRLLNKVLVSQLDTSPKQKTVKLEQSLKFNIHIAGHGTNSKNTPDIEKQQKILASLANKNTTTAKQKNTKAALENRIKKTVAKASGTVASLPVTTHFAQLIDQLNYPHNTNSLTYLSCFSGGGNRQLSVYDIVKNVPKTYNYTMACSSATATTSSINRALFVPTLTTANDGKLAFTIKIKFPQNINRYFSALEQQATYNSSSSHSIIKGSKSNKIINWPSILNNVIQFKKSTTDSIDDLGNIPLIRPRNTNKWFSISSSGKKEILELTETRMTAFENEGTLNVDKYAALIFNVDYAPIALTMSQCVPIISKSVGSSSHVIKRLHAPTIGIDKLASNVFLPMRNLDAAKLFFVKHLEVENSGKLKNSLGTTGPSVSLKNVLFLNNAPNPFNMNANKVEKLNGIIFGYGDKYYANLYEEDKEYVDKRFICLNKKDTDLYETFYLDSIYPTTHGHTSSQWKSPGKVPRTIERFRKKITEKMKQTPEIPKIFNTPSPVKRSREEYEKQQANRKRLNKPTIRRKINFSPTKSTSPTATSSTLSPTSKTTKVHEDPSKSYRQTAPKPTSAPTNTSFNDQNIIYELEPCNISFDHIDDNQDIEMPDV